MRVLVLGGFFAASALAADNPSHVTFYRDVLPILQKNCQTCHRPGEAAPMSFLTYKDVRPWSKAIREAVLLRKMPPWYADPHYGRFSNDRSLSDAEITTLVRWADGGAIAGEPEPGHKAPKFVSGWNIGQPDVVFEMPDPFPVPASGTIEYQYLVIPTNFTEDRWIQMAEVRPGNRAVVHHVIAFLRPPGSKWLKDAKPGVPFVPKKEDRNRRRNNERGSNSDAAPELLVGYAPGLAAQTCSSGQAKLVKAGSDIVFQLHYTANGKPGDDRTKIGLIFAKEPPEQRVLTLAASNNKFTIPPGAANHEVRSEVTLNEDVRLVGLMPHMHLRGKDFEYRAAYPSGENEVLLRVPRYSFSWQLFYYLAEPKLLPKGTKIECTAHFDNSPNNGDNPDPKAEVKWGDQSWEEMMIGWFDVAMDRAIKPDQVIKKEEKKSAE